MAILKERAFHWPGTDGKMTSHSNFKVRFSESSLDLVTGLLFQFGAIREVWFPLVLLWLKIGHCKETNVRFAGQRRKNDVTQQLETKVL